MIVRSESRYRVFGSPAFGGNPVTLFEVDALDATATLQRTAQRSRTVDNVFFIDAERKPVMARFFSSRAELWLCGHGLLALAFHLRGTVSGPRKVHSTYGSWHLCADTEEPTVLLPAQHALEIVDSTHWMPQALRSSGIEPRKLYLAPNDVWIVVLRERRELEALEAATIAALPCGTTTPGALIAALRLPDGPYGFRYFTPWHGKLEDCGTGSAHCYLAPLLADASAPCAALQLSPEGVAEMRVQLRGDMVALTGRVEQDA